MPKNVPAKPPVACEGALKERMSVTAFVPRFGVEKRGRLRARVPM